MERTLIYNIHQLLGVTDNDSPQNLNPLAGKNLRNLKVLEDAWLEITDGLISDFGVLEDLNKEQLNRANKVIDAQRGVLGPSWCDSHTHLVFAQPREEEFVMRILGKSYEEIAAAGGGILNSAKKVQQAAEELLLESAYRRLNEIMAMGTGAVEIKSGYGLTPESELKMLRVIRSLKDKAPIPIKSTFLGAHAIPAEYKSSPEAYVDLVIEKMLPEVADQGLADYIDVFCDRGFFTPQQTDRILEAGLKRGLKAKIHANELDYSGGVQVGVKHHAVSVDHLECTGEDEIQSLLNGSTIPTLLPQTAFFLNIEYPPARKIIDAGLPVALASDYNPGSSPSGNMFFTVALACIHMKMLPEEAINAATINGAHAMEIQDIAGSIQKGRAANFWLTEPISSYNFLPYSFGRTPLKSIFINGNTFSTI
ncbi:MAG: imidazolonepropionase [Flavobacteriales bacterium]|nr:MAG: imidazolonepropionase [Flavobacteriales bacterium]